MRWWIFHCNRISTAVFTASSCCGPAPVDSPVTRPEVEALLEEHIFIGLAGQNFDRMLCTSNIDSVTVREGLGIAGSAYIQALREHMLKEERILFALAKAVFTEEDLHFSNLPLDRR